MSDKSAIEWTDATWNPITGCSVVSPGCTNCYAMRLAGTRMLHEPTRRGLTKPSKAGPVWTGEMRFNAHWMEIPLRWRHPRRVFVCAHGDLFHESVPDAWIDQIFAVMALCPQHTFQVLTKRAARMKAYFHERWQSTRAQTLVFGNDVIQVPSSGETGRREQIEEAVDDFVRDHDLEGRFLDPDNDAHWTANESPSCKAFEWPLPNVWLGVSAERQQEADERIPHLLATPAAVRFLSAEPLLGPIDLSHHIGLSANHDDLAGLLNWIIVGGESGPKARPMHPQWARSLRDQCQAAGVAFFFKQWGEWRLSPSLTGDETWPSPWFEQRAPRKDEIAHMERVGKKAAGRLLDGRAWNEMPEARA